MILGLHHTAIATHDIDRLSEFYCSNFAMEKVLDDSWANAEDIDSFIGIKNSAARFVLLHGGNHCLEIFQYTSPKTGINVLDRPVSDPGYTHICFAVDDIASEYARLVASGMLFHAPPTAAGDRPLRATYGRDPDGNVVELLQITGAHAFNYKVNTPSWLILRTDDALARSTLA